MGDDYRVFQVILRTLKVCICAFRGVKVLGLGVLSVSYLSYLDIKDSIKSHHWHS